MLKILTLKKNSILVQPQYYSVKNKEPNTNIFSNIQYTYMICKKRPKKTKKQTNTRTFLITIVKWRKYTIMCYDETVT